MPKYLFNYQATVEVVAENEETARDMFWLETEQYQYHRDGESIDIIDSDVMLVEVTDDSD